MLKYKLELYCLFIKFFVSVSNVNLSCKLCVEHVRTLPLPVRTALVFSEQLLTHSISLNPHISRLYVHS